MKNSIQDRKFDSYRSADNDKSKVAVTLEGDSGLLESISWDDVQVTYPTTTTELYSYYKLSSLVGKVEITYSDATKENITRARRV